MMREVALTIATGYRILGGATVFTLWSLIGSMRKR